MSDQSQNAEALSLEKHLSFPWPLGETWAEVFLERKVSFEDSNFLRLQTISLKSLNF